MADYDLNLDILNIKLKSATEKLTYRYLGKIKQEMPEKSGKAKSETKITKLAQKDNNGFFSEIEVVPDYMWKVWKGNSTNDVIHFATNYPYMVFSDWPNGPDALRWSDGKFRFTVVNHNVPENKFIERASKDLELEISNIMTQIFL